MLDHPAHADHAMQRREPQHAEPQHARLCDPPPGSHRAHPSVMNSLQSLAGAELSHLDLVLLGLLDLRSRFGDLDRFSLRDLAVQAGCNLSHAKQCARARAFKVVHLPPACMAWQLRWVAIRHMSQTGSPGRPDEVRVPLACVCMVVFAWWHGRVPCMAEAPADKWKALRHTCHLHVICVVVLDSVPMSL